MSEHEDGCNGREVFSDGLFTVCYCKAVAVNTFAGARFKCTIPVYHPLKDKMIQDSPQPLTAWRQENGQKILRR